MRCVLLIFSMHSTQLTPLHHHVSSLLLKLHWMVIYALFSRQDIFCNRFETSDGLYYFASAQTIDRLGVNAMKVKFVLKRQILSEHP